MIEKHFFKRPLNLEISVATLGISRDDWFCHKPGMQTEFVKDTMVKNGYDIVPIINKQGKFMKYYFLGENNELKVETIKDEDRLYYLTHVSDVIWKMNNEKRKHYFLSNGKDKDDVVGLLSLSNFNSREFYVYLFSLIAYIEKGLAGLIDSDGDEAFGILEKKANNDDLKNQLITIIDRYTKDKLNDAENNYKEYLYLHHLLWLISSESKFELLKYSSEYDFIKHTGKIKNIRNNVAHPIKSLVRNLNDLQDLHLGLSKIYDLKDRVENCKSE
ncbi:hypothetical protein [Cellulophaga baltica]|uniref:hypothetical protein n=1 Tax=Cellulophaga baltica TaxID=76594 RepID=UPI00041F5E93|nr:hypothetical protein [Cellulophaga baltica]